MIRIYLSGKNAAIFVGKSSMNENQYQIEKNAAKQELWSKRTRNFAYKFTVNILC